jgi:cell division protein FtsQ
VKRAIIVILAVAVLAAAGVWIVGFTSLFSVRQIEVTGTALIGEVTAAAAVPTETPLARVDVTAIDARVRAIPQVADVSVSRVPPDRVVVAVVERTPVAVRAEAGSWQLIDRTGTAYLLVPDRPALPALRASGPGEAAAVAVAASLGGGLAAQVDVISAATLDDVRLTLRTGAEVTWGSAEQSGLKAEVLAALLPTDAAAYDVSAPATPTTTGTLRTTGADDGA